MAALQQAMLGQGQNSTVLLLNCNGSAGGTSFPDAGPNNFTVTANGNANTVTTSVKYGSACAAFDGTGDFLSIADDRRLELGRSDFTVEFWVRPTSVTSNRTLMGKRGDNTGQGFILIRNALAVPEVYLSSTGTSWDTSITSSASVTTSTWYHYAVVRIGDTVTFYLDGTSRGSTTFSAALNNNTSSLRFGADSNGSGFTGRMDDIRIKRIGVYTADFTAPSAELAA